METGDCCMLWRVTDLCGGDAMERTREECTPLLGGRIGPRFIPGDRRFSMGRLLITEKG